MQRRPATPKRAAAGRARPQPATGTPRRAAAASIGRRPSPSDIAAMRLLLEPWHWITAPRFRHVERVPKKRPFLLVGNHTLMGVLDVPLLLLGIHELRGVLVRSLADHLHFQVPVWRDLLTRFGAIDGTREGCRALMRAGESILVFPGGGREVFKHKGEKYRLIWKDRLGFVRLAIELGYPIVPFAAVGAEDCFDIVADADDLRRTPLGPVIERLSPRPEEIPPIVRGIGPLPRPQRFYFHFARPIETTSLAGREGDDIACRALRDRVERAVQRGIASLLAERERDPQRHLSARIGSAVQRALGRAAPAPRRSLPGAKPRAPRRRVSGGRRSAAKRA